MTRDDHDRLAAEYVIGVLDGDERSLAERLMASDDDFRAAVEAWRTRFSEWDATADAVPADEALWQRIEAGLGASDAPALAPATAPLLVEAPAAPRPRPEPGRLRGLWDNLVFWRSVGFATAAAALLLAIGLGFFAVKASRQPALIAVLMTDANEPGAVLRTFADGRVELTPLGGMEIPHNHSIQVWTFPDPNGAPVSVGVVHAARRVFLDLDKLPRPRSDQLFAVSVEPISGSPTGLPTGPVVMKGTAAVAL